MGVRRGDDDADSGRSRFDASGDLLAIRAREPDEVESHEDDRGLSGRERQRTGVEIVVDARRPAVLPKAREVDGAVERRCDRLLGVADPQAHPSHPSASCSAYQSIAEPSSA